VTRPGLLVLVTGTGTEVGKTWVAAALLRTLRDAGCTVAARKPAQSFEPGTGPTDADVLAGATGEDPEVVCPPHRRYEVAMAPPMAAAALGRPPFSIADLAAEIGWPAGVDVGVVEGAGGPRSPLAGDGDTVDLSEVLGVDRVVLVAESGLGAINAVRLATAPFDGPLVVLLNRYDAGDAVHRATRAWLEQHADRPVVADIGALAAHLTG
jgi:dethiobiotin synthetase